MVTRRTHRPATPTDRQPDGRQQTDSRTRTPRPGQQDATDRATIYARQRPATPSRKRSPDSWTISGHIRHRSTHIRTHPPMIPPDLPRPSRNQADAWLQDRATHTTRTAATRTRRDTARRDHGPVLWTRARLDARHGARAHDRARPRKIFATPPPFRPPGPPMIPLAKRGAILVGRGGWKLRVPRLFH